ncbi:hypothetical protein ACI7BZ_09450 [Xanthobacter sp. AM11]|uniref:hypothetical protein n=1 Tax=Xanthobacter sp. AM11 TaxID=3380643 RepID=UPI0039BFE39D
MSHPNPPWGPYGPYPGGPTQSGPQQAGYQWAPNGWGPPPGGAPGGPPGGAGPGYQRRIDALDVLEGVLTDGFSLSNFTRIARASGSNFWVGAAIGAGLVVLANRPDVRSAVSNIFSKGHGPQAPDTPDTPAAGPATPPQA